MSGEIYLYKMQRIKIIVFLFLIVLLCNRINLTIYGQVLNEDKKKNISSKVVVIVMDYINLEELNDSDFFNHILNNSYTAMISNRQAGKSSAYKTKLIIGTGKKLEIDKNMLDAVKSKNNVTLEYSFINELKKINSGVQYSEYIGKIGDVLNKNNMKTCVIGNSDSQFVDRSSSIIAIDSFGLVDFGELDNTVKYSEEFPQNIKSDFYKLEELYKRFLPACSFIVIDTGDISRLEKQKQDLTKAQYENTKKSSLKEIGEFINSIICETEDTATFILLSTYPSKEDILKNKKMTPIIVYNNISKGLLYSQSTRRNGIITNTDINKYILYKLGVSNKTNIIEKLKTNAVKTVIEMNNSIVRVSKLRLPILTGYAIYEIITAIIVFLYLLGYKHLKNKVIECICRVFMISNIVAPFVLLVMALTKIKSVIWHNIICYSVILVIALILVRYVRKTLDILSNISLLIVATLIIDILMGSNLIKHSVLGYDPIIGARFYGIGNELVGVFIGSSILFAGCLCEQNKKRLKNFYFKLCVALYFIFCSAIVGLSFWGANFGGAIATTVGYFFAYNYIFNIGISKKTVRWFFILILVSIFTIVFVDIISINKSSHVGLFINEIKENGIIILLTTLKRKLAMNIKLIKYTIWTKVLLCLLGIIFVMFFRPVKILKRIFKKYKCVTGGWIGIGASGIAGLMVNDSGIVLAATSMIFMGYSMFLICLDEIYL